MRYQGGKSKIAQPISEAILNYSSGRRALVSLFCGACSVEARLAAHFERVICNDAHPYLIAMWRALQGGWEPPDKVTETEYAYIRDHKDDDPALAGFVGFGCSFAAKWFGGYARDRVGGERVEPYARRAKESVKRDFSRLNRDSLPGEKQPRNFARESKNSTLNDFAGMNESKLEFICGDYRDVVLPPHSVVYADPPYKGTLTYKGVAPFDSGAFWAYMRQLQADGHCVFVSECTAPDDVPVVWEKEYGGGMKNGGITAKRERRIEKLYMLNGRG